MGELSQAINKNYTVSYGYSDELEKQIAKAAKKYARVIEYIAPSCLKRIADDKEQLREYIIDNISKELAVNVPNCVNEVARVFECCLNEELNAIAGKPFEIIEGERYINGNGDLFKLGFVVEITSGWYPYMMKMYDKKDIIVACENFTKDGKYTNDPDMKHWDLVGIYWEGVK